MTEFTRKGHWRTLPDGTRTWVSGHKVVRGEEQGRANSVSDERSLGLKARKRLLAEKRQAQKLRQKRGKSRARGGRHNDHLKIVK